VSEEMVKEVDGLEVRRRKRGRMNAVIRIRFEQEYWEIFYAVVERK